MHENRLTYTAPRHANKLLFNDGLFLSSWILCLLIHNTKTSIVILYLTVYLFNAKIEHSL